MSLPPDADPAPADALHPRALARFPEQMELATDLLRKPPALIGLTEAEARCVASAMQLIDYPKGARLMREHDRTATGYMLLLLEGEVSVELEEPGRSEGVAISVLGRGSLLGEMSLIDGEPRSSNVTALSPVQVAGLSRKGLELVIDQQPRVAAKLLAEVAGIIANRLRALSDQLRMYAQLTESQQREIDRLRRGA
ncbi:MAG TPA: cyclic nucleotide-binding domain-containing protein [Burkholderiaceae bacterium]|nr:cyclic nucleotide-binding domain-containing protein [Burkholderiaceae bacterium]